MLTRNFTPATRDRFDISLIVLHCTDGEGTPESIESYFQNGDVQGSYHYVIGRDGETRKLVDPSDIAWHAGNWSVNQRSIGISFIGRAAGFRPTAAQRTAFTHLAARLSWDYDLSLRRVAGYFDGRAPFPFGVMQHVNVPGADHTDISPQFPIRELCAHARSHRNAVYGVLETERR